MSRRVRPWRRSIRGPIRRLLPRPRRTARRTWHNLANARQEVVRAGKLASAGAGTSQNLDAMKAQQAALQAAADADQAAIDAARLNLEFTRDRLARWPDGLGYVKPISASSYMPATERLGHGHADGADLSDVHASSG